MDASITGEVLTTLAGMAATAKAVFESITIAKKKVKDTDAAGRLETALTEIRSLHSLFLETEEKVRRLNQEILRLEEENSALRRREAEFRAGVSREEIRAANRKKYQLKKVGRAMVLVNEEEPDIFRCLTCVGPDDEPVPLQGIAPGWSDLGGSHQCQSCKTRFPIR